MKCGFFSWYDRPICAKSKKIIPRLLKRIRELETKMGEENGTSSTYVSTVGVGEEVSSAGKRRKQNGDSGRRKSFGVMVLAIGILFVVVKKCL